MNIQIITVIITSRKPRHFMAGMNAKVITVFRGISGMIKLRFSAVSCKLLKKTAGSQPAEVYNSCRYYIDMSNQKGQVVLLLILVMTVALAIGISVIQRSLSDISTASKVEQSSRAFSAAEAGIEKAIQSDSGIASSIDLGNNSTIQDVQRNTVPAANQALEYPPLAKEEMAQVWLVNPSDLTSDQYSGTTLDIYWGNTDATGADKPAIEITVVYRDTSNVYRNKKYFYDQDAGTRNNNFDSSVTCPSDAIQTSLSPTTAKTFLCKKRIDVSSAALPNLNRLMLLRVRLFYNGEAQSFAVKPTSGSLPVQARLFTATGVSGGTQRKVQVFRLDRVVPFYFDYAIFSAGEINK